MITVWVYVLSAIKAGRGFKFTCLFILGKQHCSLTFHHNKATDGILLELYDIPTQSNQENLLWCPLGVDALENHILLQLQLWVFWVIPPLHIQTEISAYFLCARPH